VKSLFVSEIVQDRTMVAMVH